MEREPIHTTPSASRRRTLLGFLAGLTVAIASHSGESQAKRNRKKVRQKVRERCKRANAGPVDPGVDEPCPNCPQRPCCACQTRNGPTCQYLPADNPNPGILCGEVCGATGSFSQFLPAEQGTANFCTVGNACAAIPCPLE